MLTIIERCVCYIATRRIECITDTTRIENITSSQVSHAEKEIDEDLEREARMAGDLSSLKSVASVETDETFINGVEKSKHTSNKLFAGRDGTDKAMTAGRRGPKTGEVRARHVSCTKNRTLQDVAEGSTAETAAIFTGEERVYLGIDRKHKPVNHAARQYVGQGGKIINGVESFWADLKLSGKATSTGGHQST